MKILLTGATGYLGSILSQQLKDQYEFIGLSSRQLDLSQPQLIAPYLKDIEFDVCVHLAALTQTAQCEADPLTTGRVNVEATIELAKICHQRNKRLIFFSTEQVFNSQIGAPFIESTLPRSSTVYGQQKIAAEQYITNHLENYVILRLTWQIGLSSPGCKESPNLVRQVLNAIISDTPTKFTVHEKRGFTYVYHLVIDFPSLLSIPTGIYHFASQNQKNTYECAKWIAQRLQVSTERINQLILPNNDRYADAPRDYRLDNTKSLAFGFHPQDSLADLEQCLKDFGY